ncbi:Apolipoprotein N-acyltransferase [Phycisphaerales bacterium]|nr:Apolipoprotein N-acyltransferase [Phycisphaerales bacterium]
MAAPTTHQNAWLPPILAGVAYSLFMFLSAPPLSLWGFAIVAIWPLAWAGARPGCRPYRNATLIALGAVPFWGVSQWWVREISEFGYYPLVLAMALFPGVFVGLLAWVRSRSPSVPLAVTVPAIWTGQEFFRGEMFMDGYAWAFPAHPLIDAPGISAIASVGGAYLVSLLVAFLAGAAGDLWFATTPAKRRGIAIADGVIAVFLVSGLLVLGMKSGINPAPRQVSVAAIQTNVPQSNKIAWSLEDELRDFERFAALTREASSKSPALIVWPETMMPGLTLEPAAVTLMRDQGLQFRVRGASGERNLDATHFADRLMELSREVRVPLLIGEEGIEGLKLTDTPEGVRFDRKARLNSVYLVLDGKTSDLRYDKIHLTPFGEVMPYVHRWPALQQALLDVAARGMAFDLAAGTRRTVFEIPAADGPIRAVTPICFEITGAKVCRQLVFDGEKRRADLIVSLTNDGWFGNSDLGRAHHLQLARWRAAELGTPVLRAANTGISAIIDARGRITASGIDGTPMASRADGVLHGSVTLGAGRTVYATIGDSAGWLALASGIGLVARAAWLSWNDRRTRLPRPK